MLKKVLVVLLVLIALGVGFFGLTGIREQERRISSYRPVEVEVVSSVVTQRKVRGRKGRTHTVFYPFVEYRYRVDGVERYGSRILPVQEREGIEWSRWATRRFPRGWTGQGWYDPQGPSDSFLLSCHSFQPYFLVLIPAAGLGIALLLIFALSRSGPDEASQDSGGWSELRPARSLDRRLWTSWLVVLGWYGVGGLAAGHYVSAPPPFTEDLAVAMLSLYGALGLVPLVMGIHAGLLRRSVEGAMVTVHRAHARGGEEVLVRVEQAARRDLDVRALRIGLIGERKVKSRRGTKTVFRTEREHEEWTVALEERAVLAGDVLRGEARFILPEDAPASSPPGFRGWPRFAWRVSLHVALRGSPDFRADYPLLIGREAAIAGLKE